MYEGWARPSYWPPNGLEEYHIFFEIIFWTRTHTRACARETFLKSLKILLRYFQMQTIKCEPTSRRIIAYFITISIYNPSFYYVPQHGSYHRMSRCLQAFYSIGCSLIKMLSEFNFYRRYRKEGAKTTLWEKHRHTEKALISRLITGLY